MKKLSFAIMGLAIAGLMTFSSCKKPNSPIYNGGGELHTVTFTATTGDGSKTTVVGKDIFWKANDKINVNGTELTLDEGYGGQTSGQFTGDVEGDEYFATYMMDGNNGTQATYLVPSAQNYADLTDKLPMAAYTTTTSLNFKTMVNVLKLTIKPESGKSVKINSFKISSTKNLYGTTTAKKSGTDQVILYTPIGEGAGTEITVVNSAMTLSASTDYYVILPVFPTDDDLTLTFKGDEETDVMTKTITTVGATSPNNLFTTGDITVKYPEQPTPETPYFTVGTEVTPGMVAKYKTVMFAETNMYWDGDSYEFRSDNFQQQTTYNSSNVDLFMFTKSESDSRAQQWNGTISEDELFYTNAMVIQGGNPYLPKVQGPNPSFTVGGETGVWRLLSNDEWDYLLYESYRTNKATANGLNAMHGWINLKDGSDNDHYGVVIFPDNYNAAGGTAFNVGDKSTNAPVVTLTEWAEMSAAGARFFPTSGCRHGYEGATSVSLYDSNGAYLMCDVVENDGFYSGKFDFQTGNDGHIKLDKSTANDAKAVRLVKFVQYNPIAK